MTDTYQNREQSKIKHFALHKYLEAAVRILGIFKDIVFIDCCAGPWQSRDPDYADTSFGIAIRALKDGLQYARSKRPNAHFRGLFIELNPKNWAQLKTFVDSQSSATFLGRSENWDFSKHHPDILAYAQTKNSFTFSFIDPKGWKLASIPAIAPLLRIQPGEVLINLMSSFVTRFVNDPKLDFSDLLGNDFADLRLLSGHEQEDAVVRKYCEMVKRVGAFKYVCALPIMDPELDAFCFYLIYATRDAKGIKVFKDVERRTESETSVVRAEVQRSSRQAKTGMGDLFEPRVKYREKRYQDFSARNKLLAKTGVWDMISNQKIIPYDDCWGHALQFAGVYESDIREWIAEWEAEEKLRIGGMKPTDRVLKFDSGLQVICAEARG